MKKHLLPAAVAVLAAAGCTAADSPAGKPARFGSDELWSRKVNDLSTPMPPRVEPKSEAELAAASKAPDGAVVLFDGKSLDAWKPSRWKVENGYVEVVPKTGGLVSLESFGSCRVHVEWWTPPGPSLKSGQNRGNSGVFLMGRYEMQVLDSVNNPTYADGIAGAIYGEYPPLANACREPGRWQYYDIEFHRPVFADGKVVRPARITAYLNGILVQKDAELAGPTNHKTRKPYVEHPDKLPLELQNHSEIVRFRNVWVVPIAD